jgi:flagellar protein FliJ
MRSRESALRLKRFEADEKSRKADGLEQMMREFQHMATDLERQIQAEEERTGVKDRAHFAYSTFAKAAAQRRDNLLASIADLRVQLDEAIRQRDDARADLTASEAAEPREQTRTRRNAERAAVSLR